MKSLHKLGKEIKFILLLNVKQLNYEPKRSVKFILIYLLNFELPDNAKFVSLDIERLTTYIYL